MKYEIFSIFDDKAAIFSTPYFAVNTHDGIRRFNLLCKQDDRLKQFPVDYQLKQLGSFDDETGEISGHDPITVAHAAQFVGAPIDGEKSAAD